VPRESNFWLFTVCCRKPLVCQKILQHHGFDGATGTSQLRAGSSDGSCPQVEIFMRHILYLPVYAEMADADRNRFLKVLGSIPREYLESPMDAFHAHVAATTQKHAYQSEQVTALLKERAPFTAPTVMPQAALMALNGYCSYRALKIVLPFFSKF